MSSPAPALVPNPTAEILSDITERQATQWAFEIGTVTAASNLIEELQRATNTAVLAAQTGFFAAISQQLGGPQPPDLYGGMVAAASGFGALGDADTETFSTLYHADGANNVYKYNVSTSWKMATASAHGFDPNDQKVWALPGSPVYRIWANEVGNSSAPVDTSMLIATSAVNEANGWGWWSPSDRLALKSSGSRDQGDRDYFTVCQIVSLAPDWYPWGLLGFTWQTNGSVALKRPEPYDGANPLWVQRPANHPARTGGGAREMLVGTEIAIANVGPISAWIPTEELVEALRQAPQVNAYADDLLLAWRNAQSPAQKRVAFWQTTVVEQCRASRNTANRIFNREAAGATAGANGHE
jgi:hypothetical protein